MTPSPPRLAVGPHTWFGSHEGAKLRERVWSIIERDPVMNYGFPYDDTQEHSKVRSIRQIRRYVELRRALDGNEGLVLLELMGNFDKAFGMRIGVHEFLYQTCILSQGSEQQRERWLPDARSYRSLGCFAMTELGNSSFLRGLETTATYDRARDEFVVHSPTVTAIKWWIGMAGATATHTVALCQLVLEGVSRGLHWFVIPLRCPETGRTFPGVNAGELGPKVGRHGLDSGWIQFTHVRIPRDNMLMRWAKLDAQGNYSPPPTPEVAYATLVGERVFLFHSMVVDLAQAITVGVRFSEHRQQGSEHKRLLDFVSQQQMLLPIISGVYAFRHVSLGLTERWNELSSWLENGEEMRFLTHVQEIHAVSAGLKAWCGWWGADALEAIRRSMGGHSFSQLSGIPAMMNDFTVITQGGGPGTVVALQHGRFLLSNLKRMQQAGSSAVLEHWPQCVQHFLAPAKSSSASPLQPVALFGGSGGDELLVDAALRAQSTTGYLLALNALDQWQRQQERQSNADAAWSQCSPTTLDCSRANTFFFICDHFRTSIFQHHSGDAAAQLGELLKLTLAQLLLQDLSFHLQYGVIAASDAEKLRVYFASQCQRVRPHAMEWVQSFGFPEWSLRSVFASAQEQRMYDEYFDNVRHRVGPPPYWQSEVRAILGRPQCSGSVVAASKL